MRIGILSDTHGLLRPEVVSRLMGCDAIVHAGDIDRLSVLEELCRIAPVYAVRGNNDRGWASDIPATLDLKLGGLRIFVVHDKKALPVDCLEYDLVVYGHSHRYSCEMRGHTIVFNPGSCGPRRFRQAITFAIAEIQDGEIHIERIDIEKAQEKTLNSGTNLKQQIVIIMRETDKGFGYNQIAEKHGFDMELTEKIVRLYVTHPGVTADGIMAKMGI